MRGVADEDVIVLEGLGKQFATDPPVDALVNVNLRVRSGEWLAIVGPSGSGKSTLLNVIGCLDPHTSGSYRFDGTEVAELTDRKRARLRSESVGFVFQAFHLLGHRSVTENVMMADIYRHAPARGRRDRALAALAQVGLTHRAEFLPTRLSGGERQRVAIARALLGPRRLLLCDEPTGNLDSISTETVLALFDELHRHGMTIVTITHDPSVAARALRRVTMADGVLSETGLS